MTTLPVIATPRTELRLLEPADAPLLLAFRLANRAHLAPWEPARDDAYFTPEDTAARIARSLQDFAAGQALHFAAFSRDDGTLVATCNFSNIVRGVFQACHLGYAVAESQQGRGIAHEVVKAGIDHMFGSVGLHRIMANHMPSNLRSARLLARLGFEREGYARAYLRIAGRWEDHVLTALVNPAAE